MLADLKTIGCKSLSETGFAEFHYSSFSYIFIYSFSIDCGSGLYILKFQHSGKPEPLVNLNVYCKAPGADFNYGDFLVGFSDTFLCVGGNANGHHLTTM